MFVFLLVLPSWQGEIRLGFVLSFYILNMNLFESIIQAIIVALKLHHRSRNAHGELRDILKKNIFDRDFRLPQMLIILKIDVKMK